ncbi:hypothetical protein RHGRI_026352 [Rhododendron griersonianum]|uniref:Tetratricopeptide repeat-like superfamily protein n=1 Tax=Rhododendron griersonianum TaxID=479676 RepID=A0AAV6IUT1_9ERIC|nr:hypothetical protein RHGRI_026352 [Rhododendron griersonianum]
MEAGKDREALEIVKKLVSAQPEETEWKFLMARMLSEMERGGGGFAVGRGVEGCGGGWDKVKEARDVRLILAQIQFLQKNVDDALRRYDELGREDPNDFRPYFCEGMIYSLLDRNEEAREEFAKYQKISTKKVEVEGYLRSPLSRMKVFGTNEEEN